MKKDKLRTPEEVGIRIREAVEADLPSIQAFLSRKDIDELFVPALSDPARGITIEERVSKKYREGVWIISTHGDKTVGCMAVVPSKLTRDVPPAMPEKGLPLSEGISFADWDVSKIMELSTVVTDKNLRDTLQVKGVGAELLIDVKRWVRAQGKGEWGLITDSWVGGDEMSGFIDNMNAKAHVAWLAAQGRQLPDGDSGVLDTIARVYSDPAKRGVDGPPTVVYGIPIEDRDWEFFTKHQPDIRRVRAAYQNAEGQFKK